MGTNGKVRGNNRGLKRTRIGKNIAKKLAGNNCTASHTVDAVKVEVVLCWLNLGLCAYTAKGWPRSHQKPCENQTISLFLSLPDILDMTERRKALEPRIGTSSRRRPDYRVGSADKGTK